MNEVLLIVLGGLFGWVLGHLPDKWVYVIAGAALILGIIVLQNA